MITKNKLILALFVAASLVAPVSAGNSAPTKRVNKYLVGSALASSALLIYGLSIVNNGPDSGARGVGIKFAGLGLGGLSGTACAALEQKGLNPVLTWLGEIAARKGLIRGFGVNPYVEQFGKGQFASEFSAHAGSWIAYLLYHYAKQADLNDIQNCIIDEDLEEEDDIETELVK